MPGSTAPYTINYETFRRKITKLPVKKSLFEDNGTTLVTAFSVAEPFAKQIQERQSMLVACAGWSLGGVAVLAVLFSACIAAKKANQDKEERDSGQQRTGVQYNYYTYTGGSIYNINTSRGSGEGATRSRSDLSVSVTVEQLRIQTSEDVFPVTQDGFLKQYREKFKGEDNAPPAYHDNSKQVDNEQLKKWLKNRIFMTQEEWDNWKDAEAFWGTVCGVTIVGLTVVGLIVGATLASSALVGGGWAVAGTVFGCALAGWLIGLLPAFVHLARQNYLMKHYQARTETHLQEALQEAKNEEPSAPPSYEGNVVNDEKVPLVEAASKTTKKTAGCTIL